MPKTLYSFHFVLFFKYSTLFHLLLCWTSVSSNITEYKTALGTQTKIRSVKITDASDFLGLVKNSDVFIDKTMLLKEIMDHKEKVHLITRPHKCSKSVNMDMFKLFFGMNLDKRGGPIMANKSKRYVLFKYGEFPYHFTKARLREPLLIAKHAEFLEEHLGQYPLIHIDMELSRGSNFDQFKNEFRAIISGTFRAQDYLKGIFEKSSQDTNLTKSQRKKFKQYGVQFQKITSKDHLTLDKLQSSFALLSKMLRDHFGNPVVILMDNYDAPMHYVINNTVSTADKIKFTHFYQNFLHETFKLNPHLKKGVLTGTFRLFKEELFYEYKIDYPQTCVDDQFYEYFGFTDLEAGWLFDHRNVSKETRGQVRSLYLGYQPTNNPDLKIYNVHSLTSFLDTKKYQSYWTQIDMLEKYLNQFLKADSFKETFTALIFGNDLPIPRVELRFNATDFIRLQKFMNDHNNVPQDFRSLALSYLFSTGYLTTDYVRDDTVFLRFPNKQIAQEVRNILSKNYRLRLGVPQAKKAKLLIKEFRTFIMYDQNNTRDLAVTLGRFLAPKSPRQVDRLLLRETINYLAIHIDTYDRFAVVSDDMPDLVLLSQEQAIIFKCTVEASSATVALAEAKIYEHVLQNVHNVKVVKYVGINLSPKKYIQIKVETQPHQYYVPDT